MSDYRAQAVAVSAEDRARMSQLREEISERLLEIGLIVARTMGESSDTPVELLYHQRFGEIAASDQPKSSERRGGPLVGVHFPSCSWGCYEDPPGICYPCPAPTPLPTV